MTDFAKLSELPARIAPDDVGWASAASYWMPEHVVESAWLEHGPFAFWIMSALRPQVVVELGTHNGYSYFAMCEGIERLHLDARSFAIDSWAGDEHAGFYGEEIYDLVRSVNHERFSRFSTLLRGYFDDFVDTFDAGSIDLLHIDGRHGYDDAKHDFESWLPTLSERGVVMFHDIEERERGFGVWKLWAELAERYPSFAFTHGHGLGIVAVGSVVPRELGPLFASDEDETARIRDFYAARGNRVSAIRQDQVEREQLRAKIVEVTQQAEDARHELAGVRNSIAWKSSAPVRWMITKVPPEVRTRIRGLSSL